MLKTLDDTQQAFIERNNVKYYDEVKSAWVDAESAKTYDKDQSAWVERLILNYVYEATVTGSNIISTDVVTVSDNMASISSPVASADKRLSVEWSGELKTGDIISFDFSIDGTNPSYGQPDFYMDFIIRGVQFYKNSGETVSVKTDITRDVKFGITDGMIEKSIIVDDLSNLYTGEYDYYKIHDFAVRFVMSPTINNCEAKITNLKINGERVKLTS